MKPADQELHCFRMYARLRRRCLRLQLNWGEYRIKPICLAEHIMLSYCNLEACIGVSGIQDICHFTSKGIIGYCVQYFPYFQGY